LAYLSGHCLCSLGAKQFERTLQEGDEEVVTARTDFHREFVTDSGIALCRATGPRSSHGCLDVDMPSCDESIEVVAYDIGVKINRLGKLSD
jgi:hypothetical protein